MFESLASSKELEVALDDRGVSFSKDEKDEDESEDGSAKGKL